MSNRISARFASAVSRQTKEKILNVLAVLMSAALISNPVPHSTKAQAKATANLSNLSVSVGQPGAGFNVLPGATRRIFATVTNGATNQVQWTVRSGTAQISAQTGPWIDVTAPATGGTCSFVGSTPTSTVQFTIAATSLENTSQSTAITFNVCNAPVQISTVPFYRTLYANQAANIQSFIEGSVNDSVRWTVSSQPSGGDAKLADSTTRDTVFSATVAGRYKLTATSVADPQQSATAIMYVTGHTMPYRVTKNQTEPVDCSADPAMLGRVYEVGPSQTFRRLQDVPFSSIAPGSTVRVHNEDTTGQAPTEFHEYVQISQQASPDQPMRICGVPDAAGNLPIIDGSNATGRSDTSSYAYGYGAITLRANGVWNRYPYTNSAQFIAIEGLHVRNAKGGVAFTAADGSSATWQTGASCIRIGEGHSIAVVGNEMDHCGNGAFSAWNGNSDWGGSSLDQLWEGNHIHDTGTVGSGLEHQMYLQGWNQVVQFNRLDNYTDGAYGFHLKSRGIHDIIRYNFFGEGPIRHIDMVDVEDATGFMSFEGYIYNGMQSSSYPMTQVVSWQEAYNSAFAYGNIHQNGPAIWPIHYAYDHSPNEPARKGKLYWYNNTFYERLCAGCDGTSSMWSLFDTGSAGGDAYPQTEYVSIQAYNNIVWMDDPARPIFQWNYLNSFIGSGGGNLLPSNWGQNTLSGDLGDGWSNRSSAASYQGADNLALHISGFSASNTQTSATMPFDASTWLLKSTAVGSNAVPRAVCSMPTRFAFLPTLGYAVARVTSGNIGATDTAPETSTSLNLTGTSRRTATASATCP